MNETAKKVILAVVIVAAGAFAIVGGLRLFQGEQPQVIKTIPGDPANSMKRREMEAQQKGAGMGESGPGASAGREKDLGDL